MILTDYIYMSKPWSEDTGLKHAVVFMKYTRPSDKPCLDICYVGTLTSTVYKCCKGFFGESFDLKSDRTSITITGTMKDGTEVICKILVLNDGICKEIDQMLMKKPIDDSGIKEYINSSINRKDNTFSPIL